MNDTYQRRPTTSHPNPHLQALLWTAILCCMMFFVQAAYAAPVDTATAKRAVIAFWQQQGKTKATAAPPAWKNVTDRTSFTGFYIYECNGGEGFVLVAADDRVRPILAYSTTSGFSGDMPPQVESWLSSYNDEILYIVANRLEAEPETAEAWSNLLSDNPTLPPSNTAVAPLLSTTWNQSPYYNDQCPTGTPAGCTAIAMAQVMKYWNHPSVGTGAHSYVHSNYGTQSANFGQTTYSWTSMPASLSSASTTAQVSAVATLIYHCGVAIETDYGPSGSSAYLHAYGSNTLPCVENALQDYFGYSSSLSGIHKSYYTNSNWISTIKTELNASRPVPYRGNDTAAGGHAFVCDGYDASDNFHFNWGWGGSYDGYYSVSTMNPGSYQFTQFQGALIGVEPDNATHYTITTNSNNAAWGTVAGGGSYASGASLTLTAVANTGYHFVSWNDGNTTNPRTISVTGNATYTATFAASALYTITTNSNNAAWGTVAGGGSYYEGSTATLTAQPATGHRFVSWQDGIITNPRSFNVTGNATYTATFAVITGDTSVYWTSIVTTQPSGYVTDVNGNVTISTAEGMAWLISVVNGLNGQTTNNLWGKTVRLTANIDISAYKWTAIGVENYVVDYGFVGMFSGTFDGCGHTISGIYVNENEENQGLLGDVYYGTTKNLGVVGGSVKGSRCVGGIVGQGAYSSMRNCYSTVSTSGTSYVGGLIGEANVDCSITNCFTTGNMTAPYGKVGGIAGHLGPTNTSTTTITNCYASGTITSNTTTFVGAIAGCVEADEGTYIVYSYGRTGNASNHLLIGSTTNTNITDTSSFSGSGTVWTLRNSVSPGGTTTTDLLTALNAWVTDIDDTNYRVWQADNNYINGGYPLLGDFLQASSCTTPMALMETHTVNTVTLDWTEAGSATQWQIEYGSSGFEPGSGTRLNVTTRPYTVSGLTQGTTYDFYVRAVCSDGSRSSRCTKVTVIPDIPYWTGIVTSQPAGYVADASGNATITTAEGLAWLISTVNGLNGQSANTFDGRTVTLAADIDISAYKWTAIGTETGPFRGIFEGNAHTISGLYIREEAHQQGLFGYIRNADILNLGVVNGSVTGLWKIGGIAGHTYACIIRNCHTNLTILATDANSGNVFSGGLAGYFENSTMSNSYSCGTATAMEGDNCGGLVGTLSYSSNIYNCYTAASVFVQNNNYNYRGAAIGSHYSDVSASYIYSSENNPLQRHVIGSGFGAASLSDTSFFSGSGTTWTLQHSVAPNGTATTDLLTALNTWVTAQGDTNNRVWQVDSDNSNGGYPKLGNLYGISCLAPSAYCSTTTASSATVNWSENGTATQWQIEYGASGFTHGAGTRVVTSTRPYAITGLATGQYDFYVRSVCSASDTSNWSAVGSFTIYCAATSVPFTEGFESTALPSCWTQEYTSGQHDWVCQAGGYESHPAAAHSGQYNAAFVYTQRGTSTRLVTPVLDLSSCAAPMLTFWHAQVNWSGDIDYLSVYYRDETTNGWTLLESYTDEVSEWTKHTIMLPNASATYQVAFLATDYYGYGVVIDDVTIQDAPQNDIAALTVELPTYLPNHRNATVSGTFANYGATAITSYQVTYRVDGGPYVETQTVTGVHIPSSGTESYTHHLPLNMNASGSHTVEVMLLNPNGNADSADNNTVCGAFFSYDSTLSVDRKVLLENFTGASCVFCPGAHARIDNVVAASNDVIAVAHHVGYYTDTLTIPASSSLTTLYGSGGTYAPAMMLNRTHLDTTAPGPAMGVDDNIGNYVEQAMEMPTFVTVAMSNITRTGNTLSVTVAGAFMDSMNIVSPRIGLYITEDSITGVAQSGTSLGANYVHNHVIRASVSNIWGDAGYISSTSRGATFSHTYTYTLDAGWDVSHLKLVAFVAEYNSDINSRKILNAECAPLNGTTYTILANSTNATRGTVAGSGTYPEHSHAALRATANTGYHFMSWNDGSATNPRIVTVNANATYSATFAVETYTVTATSADASKGTVTGSGTYSYGTTATLTATANTGYHFTSWNDGNTQNPRTISVSGNATYTATFTANVYTVTVVSSNATMGSVTGSGSYSHNATATLTATATSGYHFVSWNDGNTEATRNVTVTGDITYTATFAANSYTLTVSSNDAAMGSATGSGSYSYLTSATLTAIPATEHHFTQWNDGNTQNPRTVTVTGDATYTASFVINTYTITASSNDAAMGNVAGGGTFAYNTTTALTATANTGHHFVSWNDGNTEATRTVTVIANAAYTATFAANSYTLTVSSNDTAMGTITGGGTYNYGATASISATPTAGYHFTQWNDGNANNPRTVTVTSDATYIAYFDTTQLTTYNIIVTSADTAMGSVTGGGTYAEGATATLVATAHTGHHFTTWNDGNTQNPRTMTVTADASYLASFASDSYALTVSSNDATMGTVTGGGTYSYNATATLTATAAIGHHFVSWNDGNTEATRTVTVTSNATYTATFSINSYTLTVSSNDATMGTVTGGGTYHYGTTVSIAAIPVAGYYFTQWSDDNADNPRAVTVTADTAFVATFGTAPSTTHTLTAVSADAMMGEVTGGGTYTEGATATLTATAFAGYRFASWHDGNTQNPRTVTVTADATYTATFVTDSYEITAVSSDATMGEVTGGGTYANGTTATLTATAATGHHFAHWNDGDTVNPRSITVTADATYIATFAANEQDYTITVLSANESMGTTVGSGTYAEGSEVSIAAVPAAGCYFTNWNDGNTDNPRTITVTGDATYIASFHTVGIDDVDDAQQLTLYPNPTNGQVTLSAENVLMVEVMDGVGRRVMDIKSQHTVDLSTLPSGIYTFRITLPDGVAIRKVVKH